MKTFTLAFVFMCAGCSGVSGTPATHCALVQRLNAETSCTRSLDGAGIECSIPDIPPQAWGLCVQDTKREFTCLMQANGVDDAQIAHYKSGPFADWKIKADSCPALKSQLENSGTDHGVIQVPIVPAPVKKDRHT